MYRYARGCDTRDPDAVAATFADHAVLDAGPTRVEGREAIRAFYRSGLDRDRRHFVTNITTTAASAGLVRATSYLLAIEVGDDCTIVRWGRYTDEIAVDAGGAGAAHFVYRRIELDGSAPFADAS